MIKRILQPIYAVYVAVTFAVSILAAFPFLVLVSLGNSAASRRAVHAIIRYWSLFWFAIIGMPVSVRGVLPKNGRYIIVANHISYLDALVIFPSIKGYFRPLGKKEISTIPIVGFIYRQIVIMVDRGSPQSRAIGMRLLWRVVKKEGNIVVFPEGTFNETTQPLKEFYDGAFRLAINTQTPILPILYLDTVYRWHYSAWWKLWPGKNRAIYLEPVPVEGLTGEDIGLLKKTVYEKMETELKKHNYPQEKHNAA